MLKIIFFTVFCVLLGRRTQAASLETVSSEELVRLTKSENYVVALFTRSDCEACENFENELIHVREDLVDTLFAWVVKVEDSPLLSVYTNTKEPVLVFFRHGIPLLYEGPLNEEEILTMFIENKDVLVRELTDENFEHLTQASSGATSGDWFIMFYSSDRPEGLRMTARWETVAAKIKQRVNVARVDKFTNGAATARRFNIVEIPEFIFFRHGKMYRYQIPKYDVNSFVSFAREWHRNARAERVPVPLSPFDDFTQMLADTLRDNIWIMKLGSMTVCILVIITVVSKLRRKSEAPQTKEKEK